VIAVCFKLPKQDRDIQLQDRDVPQNVSRPSQDEDAQDGDYISGS